EQVEILARETPSGGEISPEALGAFFIDEEAKREAPFRNDALLRAFELVGGKELVRPPMPELRGRNDAV
ncbi:MAG: hypothetical protein LBS00_09020, partial [Synergistaceae bacterium]|nr:hypothetical protein [Synergistaceae bacterium]